ncbi:hypothetical protein H5410_034890 [Solanum commersonii]|uniref:Uncharacterized protein n=1 Tax=Solanum commersonii TaxID=4109 RepID=A0A9J5Y112_SOLCO|nr:hypothetical protein H5410_034890 [Solanum commersonii]
MAFREDPTRILAGRSSSVLNSKLVSAAMAVALFSFALFKFSKSEPSITHSGRRTHYGSATDSSLVLLLHGCVNTNSENHTRKLRQL